MLVTATRNATLDDMRETLIEQHARKVDMIVPASRLKFVDGQLQVKGVDPVFDETGVTEVNGTYRPTEVFDEGLAEKLRIPLAYVRRLRLERPDLYDLNANGLLRGKHKIMDGDLKQIFAADDRSFLIRAFRGDDDSLGIARAFLSDRYSIMDNLDVLVAALEGIQMAGAPVEVDGCDLSDRKMYVRIKAPSIRALAPSLLAGYKSPFSGASGTENPVVFAGFVISNSEVGGGAFSLTPRMIVEVCSNGMTIAKDAMRAIHLGGRQDEGLIRWTQDTEKKELALVTAKARDAVATFLDVDYMKSVIGELEKQAGKPIAKVDDVHVVTKKLGFDEETRDSVFSMFVKGGQITCGGVLNAVTAAAQEIKDADKAAEVEAAGIRALELAFAL